LEDADDSGRWSLEEGTRLQREERAELVREEEENES
jgi:hypothetical protein